MVVQLKSISDKVGVEQIDKFLKTIFEKDIPVKEMKRRKFMSELQESLIDKTELDVFMEGLEIRAGQVGESHFTYYTIESVRFLKKQFNLVNRSKLSASLGKCRT